MTAVTQSASRLPSTGVATLIKTSATGTVTAYITIGHVRWRHVGRRLRVDAWAAQIIDRDIPACAEVLVSRVNRRGRTRPWRTVRPACKECT